MSEKELTDLIERIKERRLKLEMSYQDLSDATQISKSTLQRYETGYIKKVPINQIEILAKALHTTPSYLMGWDAPTSPSLSLTQQEETHIKKYRQLDADGKEEIDDIIDVKLAKLQRKAEEDVESLG
jgi:transcriptional regulator with XRE-family HTH domain|nr:MAG TPA: helix-turn-helix domain protein [Caudoviricetes sp.]